MSTSSSKLRWPGSSCCYIAGNPQCSLCGFVCFIKAELILVKKNSKLWSSFYCPFSTKTWCARQYEKPPCRFPVLALYIALDKYHLQTSSSSPGYRRAPPPLPLSTAPVDHGRCMAWASAWFLRVKAARRWIVETELLKKHSFSWCLSWPPWWSAEVRTNRQVTIRQWRIPLGVLLFISLPLFTF